MTPTLTVEGLSCRHFLSNACDIYKRFRIAFTTNVKHWIEETNFSKVTFMDEPDMKLSFLCTVIDYE